MKRVLILLSILFIGFTSCKKEEENSLAKEQVQGKWIVTYLYDESKMDWLDISPLGDDYMWANFGYDGVYRSKHGSDTYTGTWKIVGDKIVSDIGGFKTTYKPLEFSGINKQYAIFEMTEQGEYPIKMKAVKR